MGYPHGAQHLCLERHLLPWNRPAVPLAVGRPGEYVSRLASAALPESVEQRHPVEGEDVMNDHEHFIAISEVLGARPITALTARGSAASCTAWSFRLAGTGPVVAARRKMRASASPLRAHE
jgi:hypothetical protein